MPFHPAARLPRRSPLIPAVVVMAAALVVAACSPAASTPVPSAAAPSVPAASAGAALDLAGTRWVLSRYVSPDGAVFTVPAAVTPTAEFTADTLSGSTGCNTFSAPYSLGEGDATAGQAIDIGLITTTEMACADPMGLVEAAYLQALPVVDMAAILEGGNLQLWDVNGKSTLVYVPR